MEQTINPGFTDQLLFIASVLSLESRQLISARGSNRPFGLADLGTAPWINPGPLRVVCDGLQKFGWLHQVADDLYFFNARASAIDELPAQVVELFAQLAPQCTRHDQDMPQLWRWLELSVLDWNLHCPLFVQGLNQLLSLVLLRRLQLNGAIDSDTGRVDPRHIDPQPCDPERSQRLSDFLRSQQWIRREERHLVLNPERRGLLTEWLSEPWLAYHASLPTLCADLLFSQGEQWAEALQWLKAAGERLAWPGDRPALEQLLGKVFAAPAPVQPDWVIELASPVAQPAPEQWLGQYRAQAGSKRLQWLRLDNRLMDDPVALHQQLRQQGIGASERVLWLGIGPLQLQSPSPSVAPAHPAPQRCYLDGNGQAVSGASVLGRLQQAAQALATLIGQQPVVLSERHWHPQAPLAEHFACDYPVEAAHYLMALAGAGLFADPGMLHRLPLDGRYCEASSGCYRVREYRVRHACLADLPALLNLEQACWPEGGRVDGPTLEQRLSRFPAGQLALEFKGELVGVIYSQRIANSEGLFAVNFATVDSLFHDQGSTLQIQSLNILPAHQYSGYGDQLLEFMLQYATLLNGVDRVVGVTRCKDHPKHRHIALEHYIHSRDERGVLLDPVLRFHQLHGAQIQRLVPGYRPADGDNTGHGVLVVYDLARRQRQELQLADTPPAASPNAIGDMVRQGVNHCLGQAADSPVSPRHSLMELGLDSADLLGLGERLGMNFGVALEPSFFFRHNTLEKIIAALQERLVGQPVAPSAPPAASVAPLTDTSDFALVGISGAFPGGHLQDFYATLRNGTRQLGPVPAERGMAGPVGGYLEGIECFDHRFFAISAAEAALMDPQQRLLLQHAWLALEDAAIAPADFARQHTGVFIVAAPSEYRDLVEAPEASPFLLTSSSPCMYANRISWFFDLRGPSEYCNTACSSVLVALHRAMQAIRAGECQQALVGAVNLLLSAGETAGYRQMGFLSQQAQTRSFQAGADGYVRAEGVGVLVLKPLAAALRDGDRIHLKIKGSGVAHGGRGMALTAPDQHSLQAAMLAAYRSAGVAPGSVSHVEAHGIGSAMADAIEIDAIQAARTQLNDPQPAASPWNISSLKPLIGHCELASGMAALCKVMDAMQQRYLPGIPGFEQLGPNIRLDPRQLSLCAEHRPWPAVQDADGAEQPRRASINSYGFGGVSAHLLVEEFVAPAQAAATAGGSQLILLSAQDGQRLREQGARLVEWLSQHPDLRLADIAHTLQVGRMAMACRWACLVDSCAALRQQLGELAQGLHDERIRLAESAPAIGGTLAQALAERDLPALADYWLQGAQPDWRELPQVDQARRIGLPGYPFARERHWLAPRPAQAPRQADERTPPAENHLRQILAEVLGCDPRTLAGDPSRSLASLGLSSLGAVGLKARLEQQLQLPVSLAQLSPYLSLGEVEACLATLERHADQPPPPLLQPAAEDRHQPFALNDIQQSFLSGRKLLAEAQRVGCHIYLEFDWPELDLYRLNQAWNRLLLEHDALRLRLLDDGRQQVGQATPHSFKTRDLRRCSGLEREQALADLRGSMSHLVYGEGQPLFGIAVSLLPEAISRVHLSIDELIVDATSLELLLQQWLLLYRQPTAELPQQGASFRDYQLALEASKASPRYQRDLQYWVDKLTWAPPGLSLPKAPRAAGRERRRLSATLGRDAWQRLKERGAALQVSGSALLLGLFGLILRQANGGQAFSLISTCYGRAPLCPNVDQLIGPLISTQFFAFDRAQDEPLGQWLQGVQRQLLEDLDHSGSSGVAALRENRRRGDRGQSFSGAEVVFTSMLNNPVIGSAPSFGDARHYCVTQTPQVNLDHQLREDQGALSFSWDVAIDCYPEGLIDRLFADYCQLLARLADGDGNWQRLDTSELSQGGPFSLAPGTSSTQPFALTDQQQAYAFSRSLQRSQGSAHLYLSIDVEDLDIARLQQAWQQVLQLHPQLRTRILPNGTQQTMPAAPLLALQLEEQDAGGSRIIEEMLGQATELGDWPHVKLRVSRGEGRHGRLHLCSDLLLVDLPSRDLLVRQLLDLYQGRAPVPPAISFAGYIEALGHYQRSPAAQHAVRHWQEKFRLLPPGPWANDLGDSDSPYLAYQYRLECWPALRQRCADARISADALLISAYASSIAQHCPEPAFSLVAPGWQRPPVHPQIDALAGDFTTLSWIDFNQEPLSFIQQARRCEGIFREDQQHSTSSGLQALRKVATDKQRPRKLAFPLVFTRLNPQGALLLPEGATLVNSASRTQGVALDNLSIEQPQALLIHWDLASGRLAPPVVEAMFADYCRLLERLAVDDEAWAQRGGVHACMKAAAW